jgi:polyisoprenoid-binding protein YceI
MNALLKSLAIVAILAPAGLAAQERYACRAGNVTFSSKTPIENIEAQNHKATCVYDATTGNIEFAVLIKAFEFEKALMQEHFNENYMESNTYPKAIFKGKVVGVTAADLKKPGTYQVTVEGDLTMHGVAKAHKDKATIVVEPTGLLKASSDLIVKPEDHKIEIPSVVKDQIAKEINVEVRMDLTKM